jgi:UPF0271 protein
LPDAVIRDPQRAAKQVMSFLNEQALITTSGKKIPTHIHTFCIHGDEPTGPAVVSAVRNALEKNGIDVVPLSELTF